MGVIIAILILLILVMVHELGHFFMGRALGIGIEELSIGFGPKIFQKKSKKEILYTLRVLPLGAFVRFTGEDEDNDNPKAMNNQPVWKRFLTVLAGPAMNILMAYAVVAIYLMVIGLAYNVPVVAPSGAAGRLAGWGYYRVGERGKRGCQYRRSGRTGAGYDHQRPGRPASGAGGHSGRGKDGDFPDPGFRRGWRASNRYLHGPGHVSLRLCGCRARLGATDLVCDG